MLILLPSDNCEGRLVVVPLLVHISGNSKAQIILYNNYYQLGNNVNVALGHSQLINVLHIFPRPISGG